MPDRTWVNWDGRPINYRLSLDFIASQLEGPDGWRMIRSLGRDRDDRASLEMLLVESESDDWVRRREAVVGIAPHGRGIEATATIQHLLSDPSPYVVRAAIDTADLLSDMASHELILGLTRDCDPRTRTKALHALRRIWRPGDLEAVLRIADEDPAKQVRRKAESVLRHHADAETWRPLAARWSSSRHPRQRVWACEVTAQFGGPEDASSIAELRTDSVPQVRRAASEAVTAIGVRLP